MDEVYVVQVHTDGDYGFPRDRVTEVGICRVTPENGEVESYFSARVALPPGSFMRRQREYLENTAGLTPEDLQDGLPEEEAVRKVKELLAGRTVTSFDIGFTFKKFLLYDPWDITLEMSIMSSASVGLPPSLRESDIPEPMMVDRAYKALFPDDEKAVGDGRSALDLALKTSFIMLEMRARR